MNDKHWFVLSDGIVKGPYGKNEAEAAVDMLQNPLVWGRGMAEWMTPAKWKKAAPAQTVAAKPAKPQPGQRMWKVRVAGRESRPMTQEEMTAFIKSRSDLGDVELWTEGFENWQNIFQIHNLMDDLGVSRRKHPRVPIMGTITFEGSEGTFEGRALSISEGGLGATEIPEVKIGEKFKVILKSPNLYGPIHASAEVVFVGKEGYVGMRFLGIQTESKSAIIEYVRKFTDDKTTVG